MQTGRGWIAPFILFVRAKTARSWARRARRKLTGRTWPGRDGALPRPIPKRIWIYWAQGEDAAPPLVRACIDSWRRHNPGWEVTVLDDESLPRVATLPRERGAMSVQAWSDLVRLWLLRHRGGVWADATALCLAPLDHWLPVVARHGFFAFLWTDRDRWFVLPNVHRRLTSWFLASEPGGEIVSAWEERSFAYWRGRDRPHDYYWVHLILEWLSLTRPRIRRAFRSMPALGAYGPHVVHDCVTGARDLEETRAALATGALPVQKLRWDWQGEQSARLAALLPEIFGPAPAAALSPARR